MKRLSVDDMKRIQVEILCDYVDFCEKNKLDYFLCGGTLLGAVRHNGFIPWDDDIDVMMPRESYQRFLKEYKGKYDTFDCWSREDYYYPFAKLVDGSTKIKEKTNVSTNFGIYIDIFPIDVLPDSYLLAKLFFLKRDLYEIKMASKTAIDKKRDFVHGLLFKFFKMFFHKASILSVVRQIDQLSRKYENKKTGRMGRINWGFGIKEFMPNEVYSDFIMHDFEGLKCKIPTGYDKLLKSEYGDYMRLPPKEKRVYMHNIEIYSLE